MNPSPYFTVILLFIYSAKALDLMFSRFRDKHHFKGFLRQKPSYSMKVNYFIYVVGTNHKEGEFDAGDIGVGFTSISPGICDCPYGTMYVAPSNIIPVDNPSEYMIRIAVLQYFGLPTNHDY